MILIFVKNVKNSIKVCLFIVIKDGKEDFELVRTDDVSVSVSQDMLEDGHDKEEHFINHRIENQETSMKGD